MGQGNQTLPMVPLSHHKITNQSTEKKGSNNISGRISNLIVIYDVKKEKLAHGSSKAQTHIWRTFNVHVTTSRKFSC